MNKFIFIFILSLVGKPIFAQELKSNNQLKFNHEFSFYYVQNMSLDNNFLSDAHSYKYGFGINFKGLEYHNFKLGLGYELLKFTTVDFAKAGNIQNINLTNLNFKLYYPIELPSNFILDPNFGLAVLQLHQKSDSKNFGYINGTGFLLGTDLYYKLNPNFRLLLGLNYLYGNYKVNTSKELQEYFENSNQLLLSFGIQINL